jgi:hypothetical protein
MLPGNQGRGLGSFPARCLPKPCGHASPLPFAHTRSRQTAAIGQQLPVGLSGRFSPKLTFDRAYRRRGEQSKRVRENETKLGFSVGP